MRPLVNLASEPFRNHRLFWLVILLLFALPAYLGLRAIKSMSGLEAEISKRRNDVSKLEAQVKKIEKSPKSSVTISLDQNRSLYAASELIARRAFSWSQLLNDIERNLPPTVRVLRVTVSQIQPQDRDGSLEGNEIGATLMLEVIGKSGPDITLMMNKFQDSRRFKVFPLTKKPVEGTGEVEYTLKIEYFPPSPALRPALNSQIAEKK